MRGFIILRSSRPQPLTPHPPTGTPQAKPGKKAKAASSSDVPSGGKEQDHFGMVRGPLQSLSHTHTLSPPSLSLSFFVSHTLCLTLQAPARGPFDTLTFSRIQTLCQTNPQTLNPQPLNLISKPYALHPKP